MGKQVYKTISDLSMSLPPAYIYETHYEYGAQILHRNPKAEYQGKPLEPKKKYGVKKGVPVNHYRTMKKILAQRGMKGVDEYVRSFYEPKGEENGVPNFAETEAN